MIGTALTAGALTAIGLALLAQKFGNGFVKRLLAYDWAVDVAVTFGLMWVFAVSGTISGMMTGIVTGLLISLMLSVAKKIIGYRKLEKDENGDLKWTDHEGQWKTKVSEVISNVTDISAAKSSRAY